MKTSDIDILMVPGWNGSGPEHWQTRWETRLRTGRRIGQADWDTPLCEDWVGRIIAEVALATRPAVLVAHSLGCIAVAHAAHKLPAGLIAGAFLVAPPDLEGSDLWPAKEGEFWPPPMVSLPCPSVLVASSTDPYCAPDRARQFSDAWGSTLIEAGDAGHINSASGHGPWPEGLMRFGWFLKKLDAQSSP